jgi:ADP-ribose pyrophosphatase
MSGLKPWRRLSSRTLFTGERVLLREDQLELPDGGRRAYPVLELGQSAAVLPRTATGEVVLVRQYRHVPGKFCWEIPGGGMQPGEAPEVAAQRELREEAGYRAGRLTRLGGFWPNNAYLDEIIHVFLAEELVPDPLPPDQDEELERRHFPFAEALAMARDDRIGCGLTKLALFWAALLQDGNGRGEG